MSILLLIFGLVIGFIIYDRILKMYYTYWYYTKQGVVPVFFPLPFVCTNSKWITERPKDTDYSKHFWFEMYHILYGEKVPPVTLEMRIPQGIVFFNDPEYINEIFVNKNKYFDKSSRFRSILDNSFGNSILFKNLLSCKLPRENIYLQLSIKKRWFKCWNKLPSWLLIESRNGKRNLYPKIKKWFSSRDLWFDNGSNFFDRVWSQLKRYQNKVETETWNQKN